MKNYAASLKNLSYLWKAQPFPLEKPVVIQFPVIDICNSRCQMCRIWENKKSYVISPEQLDRSLRNPLFSEVKTVGLNGGEPTLRKDIASLADALFVALPKIEAISLITNAYKSDEVIKRISEVGEVVQSHGGALHLMVSLDGYGDVHDRVRGKPGNFERAQRVIDFIQNSPLVSSLSFGCTIIKENVYGLADLLEYSLSKGVYIKYRIGIPHKRLYTEHITDPYAVTEEEKYHIAEFLEGLIEHYETNLRQRFFYRSLIDQILHNAPRKAGCDWQHRGATITSKGELLFCAVQSKVLSNIQDSGCEEAYFGNADHLKSIIQKNCSTCTHDYVGLPDRKQLLKEYLGKIVNRSKLEPSLRHIYSLAGLGNVRAARRFNARRQRLSKVSQQPSDIKRGTRDSAPQVMICGWYGTETLGDKAILGGIINVLTRTLGSIEVKLVSLYPYVSNMTRSQMQELHGCQIITVEEGLVCAGDVDLLVVGGGPLMALDQLADLEYLLRKSRANGIPTLVAGCGIGPLGNAWHNKSIAEILSLADGRIYRDKKSLEVASKLGIDTSKDLVAEDPAFTWLSNKKPVKLDGGSSDRQVLLLGLRDFPYQQYAGHLSASENRNIKEKYENSVVVALKRLTEVYSDLTILPLPMCTNHFGGDDRWFYRRLFRLHPELSERIDTMLLQREMPPDDYCRTFQAADVALTMRFHSLVFSLGLDVPAVAIDYTIGKGKVFSLSNKYGVPQRNIMELNEEFIFDEVSRVLNARVRRKQELDLQFEKAIKKLMPMLMRSEVTVR